MLACPVAPEGFPAEAEAVMPSPVRAASMRLAHAYDQAVTQLRRLIAWHDPAGCP